MTARTRRLRRFLSVALLLFAAYLVAGNALLNSTLAEAVLNRHPERFNLTWSHAITLFPGHVRAWNLRVDAAVRSLRWHATADRAAGRIALWPLLRRELRLPSIAADEVRFAVWSGGEDLAPRPPRDDAWVLHFPHIRTESLRELRWEEVVLSGRGTARFGLWKQLRGGALEILPSRLEMMEATAAKGDEVWIRATTLQASAAMQRHRAADHPGRARLALLDAGLRVSGVANGADIRLGGDRKWSVTQVPGDGRVDVDVALQRGRVAAGGRVGIEVPVSLEVDGGERRLNRLHLSLDATDRLRLRASLPQQPQGSARLDADLHLPMPDLAGSGAAALIAATSGRVDLRWRFDSLAWLSEALVHNAWLTFDGAGELDAQLEIAQGRLAPGSRFEVPGADLVAVVLDNRIRGRARALGRIESDPADAAARARVDFVLDDYAMVSSDAPDAVYVRGRDLRLGLESSGELARFRDALVARLRFEDAEVPDLTRYNRYLPGDSLRFSAGRGTLDADLSLDPHGRVAHGTLAVRARGAALRFARIDLSGDVSVDTRLRLADLASRRFDLDGSSVELRRMAFTDPAGRSRRDWWMRLTLPRAHAEWGRPLSIDGSARIQMKDVGFLLALFAQKKAFPGWVTRLVDAGPAQVDGSARLRGRSLVLDRLRAENDRFRMRARLSIEDAAARGDLLLRWGVLAIGVELAPQERDWHLRGATEWYESRPDLLPAAAR